MAPAYFQWELTLIITQVVVAWPGAQLTVEYV